MQVRTLENQWTECLRLRTDRNNSVSAQSLYLNDGSFRTQRGTCWSRQARPLGARFEERIL